MDKQSVGATSRWFSFYNSRYFLGSNSEGHVARLQYLPYTNTILGVTSENCIVLFDASSGECLQNFKIGCRIGQDLLLCYHNCTGSIVLSDGFSMGYRCHTNGVFRLKTILQVPLLSDTEFVAVELSVSEAELLMDMIGDDGVRAAVGTSNAHCLDEMLEILVKEVNSHHSDSKVLTSKGSYPGKSTLEPFSKWASIHISVQHSILRSACQTLLNCYDNKPCEDGLFDENYTGQHRILDGSAVVSSILHQLSLIHSEEKSESSTLPDSRSGTMCSELSRRLSFANWPHPNYRYAQPSTMAEAGFFHQPAAAGDDRAICFACDVCLVCWEPTDEPWSEHERHSPLCPFVRCEPTLNVPIAITHANQPATSNPLLRCSNTHYNPSGAQIDFLAVGESCSLIVAASRGGDFIYWDTSNRMPVLRNVSTISKSHVFCKLKDQIANIHIDGSQNFPFNANLHIADLSLSSLCIIDCLQTINHSTDMSPQKLVTSAKSTLELEHGDDTTGLNTRLSLGMKHPVLAIGAVAKVTPTSQECSVEEMHASLYYSLLIFASSEHFSTSNHEEEYFTAHQPSSKTVQKQYDQLLGDTDYLVQQDKFLPDLGESEIADSSDSTHSFSNKDYQVLEDPPHGEAETLTNLNFADASYSPDGTVPMKVLQVVVIDHKEELVTDHELRLQVIKNIAITKNLTKLVATTSQEEIAFTEVSHNLDSVYDITNTKIDDVLSDRKDFCKPPSFESSEKYGLVTVFDLMQPLSSHCVTPKWIKDSDNEKTWVAAPSVNQMFELPHSLASVMCNDEADGDSADGEFSQGTTGTNYEPEALDNFQHIEHPLMLMLGDDGLLRLFDVKLVKIVHKVTSDDDTTDGRYTAITYCSNIDQVCAITATGRVSFIKIGRHLHPDGCFHGVAIDNTKMSSDSAKKINQNKPTPQKKDLVVNHPLTESSLQTLLQLTTFEKLEPRFHAKTPPHWIEMQLKELTNVVNCPSSIEDTFQTIPRKARMGQSNVPVQVKQQRRHLRHPNEHYASDAYRYMRAWRMHHDSAKEEIVELIFPRVTNISHIDLQFVLSRKLKSGTDIQVTLLKQSNTSRGKSSDVKSGEEFSMKSEETKSVSAMDHIYQRIKHLLTERFVERLMEMDVENPVLLVTAAKAEKENVTEYILMDGSTETIVAICKNTPSEISCGSMVELKGYMRVKIGADKLRIIVESFEVYPEQDFQTEKNDTETMIAKQENNDPTVSGHNFDAEKASNKEPNQSWCGDSNRKQYPNFERSDILFGPVLISNYVDVTGLGGVITIASRWLTKNSRHRSLLLLVENVPDVAFTSTHDSDERNGEFRSCACLQEVSITVFKSKRVDIMHERAQRFGLLCSRTLHAKLLLSLCNESAFTGMFVSNSLSQKVMALDILNWVAALETADPNERISTDCFRKNNSNTVAVTRSLSQCQSLTYLLCFFESKEISQSKFGKRNRSTDRENVDKLSEVKFNLETFFVSCFLKSGRDVGIRALRFIFRTVLSVGVQGQGRFKNVSGTEVLYDAVVNSLKYAAKRSVKSIHGIYCLYRILYVMLTTESRQSEGKIQMNNPKAKLQECIELLVDMSSLMKKHIHPFSVILRTRYGLYTSPFDFAEMASDLDYLWNRGKVKSRNPSDNGEVPFAHPWDNYFSEEDVDMCVFVTPQKLGCRKVLAASGINDGYYSAQLACIECQPLHFNCIHSSEGCTFTSEVETTDDWAFPNGFFAESTGSSSKDIQHTYPWLFMDNVKSELKNSAYVNNILECYTDLGNELTEDISNIKLHTGSKNGKDAGRYHFDARPEKEQEAPPKSSNLGVSEGLDDPDAQPNIDIDYHIPNLSFLPPRSTQLNISRMHSGGRRSAVLDFCHIVELTDINIPACKNLSSLIVEAWPVNMKSCPTIDATEFFTVAISLDICDHDFTISTITPTILTRFLRVTAIGRYGTSNAQTVVNLGSFHGRPACSRLCAPEGVEQNRSKCTVFAETTAVPSLNHSTEDQSNIDASAFRVTDAIVVTKGLHALERYLASLRNYSESLNCQYQLACSQLKSIISISSSNLSSFSARVGNTYRNSSAQAVSQAYKKCIAIQLQRSRVQHAIGHIESMSSYSQSDSTKSYSEANQSCTFPQIEIHCELMLNLLLSIYPHVLKSKLQIIGDTVFTLSSAEILFKNLVNLSHPRICVQATGVLLSYYAPFPWWGSFLVSCLKNHSTVDYSRNLSPSQRHFFCNILVFGQRSLAVPGKGEEIIERLLNLISTVLPNVGHLVKANTNFKLLNLALLLVSHLAETILSMNESHVAKFNPQVLSMILTVISDVDGSKGLPDSASHTNVVSPCPEDAAASEPAPPKAKKLAKAHLWHPNFSEHAHASAPDQSNISEVSQPCIPATLPRSSSWDFMSLSGFENKGVNAVNHHAKILRWLQAVHAKLRVERTELMQLGQEERFLRKKISALGENTDNNDASGQDSLKMRLSVISKKASERYKAVLGYRRTLDRKAVKSILLQSKPFNKKSKDSSNLPQSSSFIKVPMELCWQVVKQILSLLLQHVIAIPADLVVLSCKVCSQLCHWASFQCINENEQKLTEDSGKKHFSPLSVTNLLSPDELTKLLLLSSGTSLFASENDSTPSPTTYREGPWICHALRNLLCDLLKYENAGLFSCSTADSSRTTFECGESLFYDGRDFTVQDANPTPAQHENIGSVDSSIGGQQNHDDLHDSQMKVVDDLHDSRMKVVDNFIHLSEVLITDVKNLIKSQEEPVELLGGYRGLQGYAKSIDTKLKQSAPPEDCEEFFHKSAEFFQKMRDFVQTPSTTVSSGSWNAKCPEGLATSHPICSHVFDQRSVHGIGRKVLLTSKVYGISHMVSVAKSLKSPPSLSLGDTKEHGKFFAGCEATVDCVKTATALQRSIGQILDRFRNNNIDFSAVCYVILLIQRSYNSLASKCRPPLFAHLNVIGLTGLKKLLKIATSDSAVFCTDNVRLWNLILNLLNSLIDKKKDPAGDAVEVQELFKHDLGISRLLTRILSAKFSASCLGHAHIHKSLPMLGPSVCSRLDRLFEHLHVRAINAAVQDPVHSWQLKPTMVKNLRIFYLSILSSLVENSAVNYTSQTPVDGQIAFVKAIVKIYHETSSENTFPGDLMCLTKIVRGISDVALHYLSWSKININRNQSSKIEPSSLLLNSSLTQAPWLNDSPRDELMLNLLKLASLLCQENFVSDVKKCDQELSSLQPVSDLIFEEEGTIHALLSALSISNGSTATQDSVDSFLSDIKISATTTCDGVFLLLLSLFNSSTAASKKVHCLMNYLKGMTFHNRNEQQEHLERTGNMSYPLLAFITQVFCSSGTLVDAFIAEGGVKVLIIYLVASLNQGFDPRNHLVSQTMQYLTAASERSEALTPSQPIQMQTESNWPTMKGFNPHPKITMKEKYYGYAKAQADAVMFVPPPHSKVTADSWKTEENFDFATIATVECSDPAAPPADSLLKPKAVHRRTRTPVWSYHFPGNVNWVSLTLHFPTAFVLSYVKLLPMILSLSTSPSAVILEVNQCSIPDDCNYQPLSTPLVTSGMGDIILIPPTEEVVSSLRILLKRPLESSSIGLTRISVTGTSFMSYEAPAMKPNSFMKINSSMFTTSNDSGPNTSSSIWILLLYHFVRLHDVNVLQEIRSSAVTVDELIPTLCTLLELSSVSPISRAIETILLKVAVAAKPVGLIDCIFRSHCITRYFDYLDETSHDPSDHFIQIIYTMCKQEDSELQLRLERCMYWIMESSRFTTAYVNLNAANADYIHAMSCGLWECSDTKSAKALDSDLLLKSIYESLEIIAYSQPFKVPYNHYSPRLKESLDWVLCSLCQINVNCYFSVLKWMGLDHVNSKVTSLTSNQIETLASITQTERTADVFLSRGIIKLFANGLQRFCQSLITPELDDSSEVAGMVEVNPNNVVVIVELFSHLCNILPIQCWLGSEQGSRCWHVLLTALDHAMLTITQGAITGNPPCTVPISLLMDLQESTINLMKQISRCNQRNRKVVSSAICNMISSHSGRPGHRLSFSGFLRSLLLQVILEDETVTVYVKSICEKQVQCNQVSNNASHILRHPMFGTGHYNRVFEVGINSSIKEISSIVTGKHTSPSKHLKGKHKNKEPVSKPEMNFHKSPMPTYASVSKSTNPIPVFSLSPGDIIHIETSGKNAQDKRKSQVGNAQSLLSEDSGESLLPKILFACDEVKIGRLSPDDTLIHVLERYQVEETCPFFNRVQLEISCTVDASARQKNGYTKAADVDKNTSSKASMGRRNLRSNESDVKEKSKTIFQVFAESGGLSLIASHLPSLTLDTGPVSVNDIAKAMLIEDPRRVRADSLSYMDTVSEWIGFDDDDYLYAPFDEPPLVHPGVEISISDGLPKPHVPTRSASDKPPSSMKCCVPSFTFTALRSFLQVPLFAEELLKDYSTAKCLLRLALGVVDDGKGQFIPGLTLAPTLPLLPFNALSRLLSEYDCSTPSGLTIREAMTFQTISLHIVVACITGYSHIEPSTDSTAGKLLKFVLSQGFSSLPTQKKSTITTEKSYWAQGTGFGTGSTSSDWNPEEVMKKQKKDEECLTIFIQILANFVCPAATLSDFEAGADHDTIVMKCISSNQNLVETLTDLVTASGLISAVASYLRNDSVLDMSSHVPLYHSLLSMIRSFSLCPSLSWLLINRTPPIKHAGDNKVDVTQDSIVDLLAKMKKCIDTYSNRLEALNTSLDVHGDEGFSFFVSNVQKTEHILRTIMQESDKNLRPQGGNMNILSESQSSMQSLEEVYMNKMKELQFDTALLVQENEKGTYVYLSGHHYKTHIKESANVADASRARRLAQEAVTLSNSLPLSLSSTVFVRCDEERLDVMKVLITGPTDTPYANGCFEFDVFFPVDYNKSPPLINMRTTGNQSVRFNPNLYNDGKVCLSILNTWHGRPEERWNPQTSSFLQILVSIQSLILVKEPYFNEPGYERSRGTPSGQQCSLDYDANIQQATVKWAMLEQLRKPSECFRNVILNHFWMKKDEILKQCDKWLAEMKKHSSQQKSRKSIAQNYSALQKHVSQLQTELRKLDSPPSQEKSEESE